MPGRFLVGVSVFVVHAGRVLLLRRDDPRDGRRSPWWEPISGRLEQGETPLEAATRQVLEDTGLAVEGLEPFHTFTIGPGDEGEELIGICFTGTVPSSEVALGKGVGKSRWVPVGKLAEAPVSRRVAPLVTAFQAQWATHTHGDGGGQQRPRTVPREVVPRPTQRQSRRRA